MIELNFPAYLWTNLAFLLISRHNLLSCNEIDWIQLSCALFSEFGFRCNFRSCLLILLYFSAYCRANRTSWLISWLNLTLLLIFERFYFQFNSNTLYARFKSLFDIVKGGSPFLGLPPFFYGPIARRQIALLFTHSRLSEILFSDRVQTQFCFIHYLWFACHLNSIHSNPNLLYARFKSLFWHSPSLFLWSVCSPSNRFTFDT